MTRYLTLIILSLLLSYGMTGQDTSDYPDSLYRERLDTLSASGISADKKAVIYRLDRKKISGSAVLSAAGGTAADILKSMPSVRIDADGEVSFRGSTGFLVFVDGKQSMLEGTQALEQIPAENIEDIEIITTPSARYKTDGDTGIINIVTRRHEAEGLSGSLSVSGSTLGSWGGDVLLSSKKGYHRWYAGGSASQIRGKSDFRQHKSTIVDNYKTTSDADGTRFSRLSSYIGRAGWEYDDYRHRVLVEIQAGDTDNARGGDMDYHENRMQDGTLLIDGTYRSRDRYSNEKQLAQIIAEYACNINDRGDKITAEGRLRYDWHALEYTESNMFTPEGQRHEGTRGYEDEHHWDYDWNIGYQMNYRPEGKFEAGYQMTSYSEEGDYSIKYWDLANADFKWQDDLYAPFFYRRQIHSLFAMITDKFGPVSFDAGLRGEYTRDILEISVKGADRNIRRIEVFPSAHISYEAPGKNHISAAYSYRTNRPGIWQLEPYITYEDYYTRLVGNPDIRPEYIHAAELGYRKSFKNGHSISATAFYRGRKGKTDRIRVAYQPGVTLDSLVNAGNDFTYGLEIDTRMKPLSWWDMTVTGSLYGYRFTSTAEGCSDASNISYTLGLINNFKAGRTTRVQFDANAVGPAILTQGLEKAYMYFDIAVRQQVLKDRLTISLAMHDAFRTARYKNSRSTPSLISSTWVRPLYPDIRLSVTYTFNGYKTKEQSGSLSSGATFHGKDF